MLLNGFLPVSLLASLALASPILTVRNNNATAIIAAVAPKSVSCDGVKDFPEECATADHAAKYLPAALQKYGIYRPGEIAGVLSLMAFETGDFRYNRNHFPAPGRPGQGTRNLQMPKYNLMYALDIPELKQQATEIAGGVADGASLSDDKKNAILDLVLPDDYTWGSAAWFLSTQCDQDVRDGLAAGTVKGFTLYMECIGTSGTEDRVEYWTRAKAAFNMA
ncbi:hypothetical protein CT0861_08669 [Colletotrichum tofieldiae]|uniref:Uncharacterized protein n=1 Tax=Colletotrichum tofieldiae TaxID=708197 RepID=A0A161YCV4_9PEZI|nr:hypothetical protein CT0861_08669 [Colletotrichum tofieldiae]GKT83472.1 hypothetical protein Ct61P_01322 [Colletotrichum tofieldiae]